MAKENPNAIYLKVDLNFNRIFIRHPRSYVGSDKFHVYLYGFCWNGFWGVCSLEKLRRNFTTHSVIYLWQLKLGSSKTIWTILILMIQFIKAHKSQYRYMWTYWGWTKGLVWSRKWWNWFSDPKRGLRTCKGSH